MILFISVRAGAGGGGGEGSVPKDSMKELN